MRLLTHNMLVCNVKACQDTAGREPGLRPLNFPLKIVPEMDGVVVMETVFSKSFMLHIMQSIDYPALVQTTKELNHPEVPILPDQIPADLSTADELLKLIHRVILDTNIVEGELVCNNCSRCYVVNNAVPNMMMEEDEMIEEADNSVGTKATGERYQRHKTMARRSTVYLLVVTVLLWDAVLSLAPGVRIAVPDLAGMLYPLQTQRIARFGTASYATTPFFATRETSTAAGDALPPCEDNSALCLEIVWTSAFTFDPFVLAAFESKFAVASKTFDSVTSTAANVSPVIEGSDVDYGASSDNGNNNNTTNTTKQTLWRFHAASPTPVTSSTTTTASTPTTTTIDLLFRLRQQSQLRSARDQLLVHVVATQIDPLTSHIAVETFSVYGNQHVQHTVTRVSSHQVRLDLRIDRNTSRADVVLPDAYPLLPAPVSNGSEVTTWRIIDTTCLHCTAQLLGCSDPDDVNRNQNECSFQSTTAALPSCLRTSFGLSTATFQQLLVSGTAIPIRDALASCLNNLLIQETNHTLHPQWANATRAMGCLAANKCPFGPVDGVLAPSSSETKTIQLSDISPFVYTVTWNDAKHFRGYFELTFGASLAGGDNAAAAVVLRSTEINDTSNASTITSVLQATLLPLEMTIAVRTVKSYDDVGLKWSTRVELLHVAFPDFVIRFVMTSDDPSVALDLISEPGGATSLQVVERNLSQLTIYTQCDECALELEPCREDDTCRQIVLPCVIRLFEELRPVNASVDPVYGTYRVGFVEKMASTCFKDVSMASWNPIRQLLLCKSRHQCRVDTMNTRNVNEQTFVRFQNGTQVIAVPAELVDSAAVVVALSIASPQSSASSAASSPFQFHTSATKLASFLKLFVLQTTADVAVEIQAYAGDTSMVQLRIVYSNTLWSSNPSFAGTPGLVVLEDTPPVGYWDVGDLTTFSVVGILKTMRSSLDVGSLPPIVSHSWLLAAECEACNAQLFGCSIADVRSQTCSYETSMNPVALCIQRALPRATLVELLDQSRGFLIPFKDARMAITTDITRCLQTTTALSLTNENKMATRIAASSNVSCYSTTSCPFGPLDLVRDDRMVQLTASAFVHTLRFSSTATASFQIHLSYWMGSYQVASATITTATSNITQSLSNVLAPIGIRVLKVDHDCDSVDCTIAIHYGDVVGSDFAVQIAQTSVPHPSLIQQSVLRPTTRLVVTPRIASKVYSSIVQDNTTTNSSSSSSGSGSGSQGSPAAADPILLPFSSQCGSCDDIHLTVCAQSTYCRTQLAPTLVQALQTSNVTDLAATVRSSVAGDVFFDWWEPLQRWLVCYARQRCPVSQPVANRTSDTFVEFTPATTEITDVWMYDDGTLSIQAPTGSSLHGRSVVVMAMDQLQERLSYMTQGISNVMATRRDDASGRSIVAIQYEAPYLGEIPLITALNGTSHHVTVSPASLLLKSTLIGEQPSWSALTSKLSAIAESSAAPPVACADCAQATLSKCQERNECSGYLLECLVNSMEIDGVATNDLSSVFTNCAMDVDDAADWLPVYQYMACLRDRQCPMNDTPINYLRLHSGLVRFFDGSVGTPAAPPIVVMITAPGQAAFQFEGTRDQIRDEVQRVLGNASTVEMIASPNSAWVELVYHGYLVDPVRVQSNFGVESQVVPPRVVLYSKLTDTVFTAALTTTFAGYMQSTDSCLSTTCGSHLDACVRSDSVDSLVCRHRFLPQLYSMVVHEMTIFPRRELPDRRIGFEFGDPLRQRFLSEASKKHATLFLAKYLLCVARSSCALSRPSSRSPKMELYAQAGTQSLSVATLDTPLTAFVPRGIDANERQVWINLLETPAQVITRDILELSDVAINVTTQPPVDGQQPARVQIRYGNYLGFLMTFEPEIMMSRSEVLPLIALASRDVDRSAWTRLTETLANYSQVNAADMCGSCKPLLTGVDETLALCVARQLKPLSVGLLFSIYDCASTANTTAWLSLAQFFQCFAANACDVATGTRRMDMSAVYVGNQHGRMDTAFEFADGVIPDSLSVQVTYPRLPGSTNDPETVVVAVTRSTNYSELIQAVDASLAKNGQVPVTTLTEKMTNPFGDSRVQLTLSVTISNFFGFLPSLSGSAAQLSSFLFANPSDVYMTPPGQAMATLIKSYVFGTSAPVLKGACAPLGAELYGCSESEIATGVCSYNTASSQFGSCLRDRLPQHWYTDTLGPAAMAVVDTAFGECFQLLLQSDEASPAAQFRDDQWHKFNEVLAKWETTNCPFGPLETFFTLDQTVRMITNPRNLAATIPVTTFQALFRVKMGFRVLESDPFTQDTTASELTTLLATVLPTSTRASVVVQTMDTTVLLQINLQYLYIDYPVFRLEIDAGADGLVDASDTRLVPTLMLVDANTTYLAFNNNNG